MIDEVIIKIKAGDGGNGSVHFKRNAQTAKGGPDGGNGGNGGSIYFHGSHNLSDLKEFQYKKSLKAEDGIKGREKNLYGRNGKDLIIKVPIGTFITDHLSEDTLEITDEENLVLLAHGGKGGRGNIEFKSAINQTPMNAEKGEKGEEKEIKLELKLIADIGLIGLPNAGKSSLLEVLTNATPKIGNYPFTTLEPNLGVMGSIVLADIPGLIEGASTGKGLGIKFLKHVEKTKLLVHCIDSTNSDVLETYNIVRKELKEYNEKLLEKNEIVLLTKSDLITQDQLQKKTNLLKKINKNIKFVSIFDDEILKDFANFLKQPLK